MTHAAAANVQANTKLLAGRIDILLGKGSLRRSIAAGLRSRRLLSKELAKF